MSAQSWLTTVPNISINSTVIGELVRTSWFTAILALLLVLSIIAILLNLLAMTSMCMLVSQHVNTRILFGNMHLWTIAISIFQIVSVGNVYRGGLFNECVGREFWATAAETLQWSFYAISIERAVATIRHASYTDETCALGILLVPLCWVQGAVRVVSFCMSMSASIKAMSVQAATAVLLCPLALTLPPITVILNAIFDVLVGVFAVVANAATLRLARRRYFDFVSNQAHFSLNSRLQLRHSIELTETLTPLVIVHAVVWVLFQALGVLISCVHVDIDVNLQLAVVTLTMDSLITGFALANPLLAFYRSEQLREKCIQLFRKRRSRRVLPGFVQTTTMATQQHFETLRNAWTLRDGSILMRTRQERYTIANTTSEGIPLEELRSNNKPARKYAEELEHLHRGDDGGEGTLIAEDQPSASRLQ